MADEKIPRPRIESEAHAERPAAGAQSGQGAPGSQGAPAPADGTARGAGETVRDGAGRVFAWVRRTFPGHEHAFWGGVLGFITALLFLALGPWRALVIVVLVIVGVAVGQTLDGDSKIMDLLRRLFSRN